MGFGSGDRGKDILIFKNTLTVVLFAFLFFVVSVNPYVPPQPGMMSTLYVAAALGFQLFS